LARPLLCNALKERASVFLPIKRYSAAADLLGIWDMAHLLNVLWQVQQAWIFQQSLFFAIPLLIDTGKIAQWRRGWKSPKASHVFPLAQGAGLAESAQTGFTAKPTPYPSSLFQAPAAGVLKVLAAGRAYACGLLHRFSSGGFPGRLLLGPVRIE